MTTHFTATYQIFTRTGAEMPQTIDLMTDMDPTSGFLVRLARHFVQRRYRGEYKCFVITKVVIRAEPVED